MWRLKDFNDDIQSIVYSYIDYKTLYNRVLKELKQSCHIKLGCHGLWCSLCKAKRSICEIITIYEDNGIKIYQCFYCVVPEVKEGW